MIYENQIHDFDELPIPQKNRKITDICCGIIGVIFGLTMFIIACAVFNKSNLMKANYPTDMNGHICSLQTDSNTKQLYPFLFFSDIENPLNNRYCVKQCPQAGLKPQCGFGDCTIGVYPNYPHTGRLGSYCVPQDKNLEQLLNKKSGLNIKWNLLHAIDYLLIGLGISVFLGLIWMFLVQYFPRIMIWVAIVLAILLLFIACLVFFINSGSSLKQAPAWAIILGIVCLIFIAIFTYYLILHRRRINISAQFLYNATLMMKDNCIVFVYIPVFMVITFLFGILIVFQYLAYASNGQSTFFKNDLYYRLDRPWFLTALLVIEAIWGYSFIRDAFDYCVSGCAVQWYFKQNINCIEPVKRLFCKNFGTVVGGSFLNAFLYFPGLIVNLLFDDVDCCLCNLFDLTRDDAYAYTYLTGSSYCNSCRQCQYLCYRSDICRGNQSTNNIYALAARLVFALSSVLIVYWISTDNMHYGQVPPYLLFGVFLICVFVTGYFIDIHVDTAQALLITFLAEYEIDQNGYKQMKKCRSTLKDIIEQLQIAYKISKGI